MLALQVVFWVCAALIVWTQLGYALTLAALVRLARRTVPEPAANRRRNPVRGGATKEERLLPSTSLIVAAHDEQDVIATKVANALALDYPRELLQLIVA